MSATARATTREKTKRKARVPISGRTDQMAVEGKDPAFYYRWVYDTSEKGTNILKHTRAGYVFAEKSEGLEIGSSSVYINDHTGSHIRVPAGRDGGDMYLMKLPMEYREEDLAAKKDVVDGTVQQLHASKPEGSYGEIKISHK